MEFPLWLVILLVILIILAVTSPIWFGLFVDWFIHESK